MTRPLLILRPEPGASATAARAAALGLRPVIRPLFEARAIAWTAPDASKFDAVLLTSANAVRLGGDQLANYFLMPTYAVGQATAEAARAAGFVHVTAGVEDVDAVTAMMSEAGHRNVIHLAGRDRTEARKTPVTIEVIAVYASEVLPVPEFCGPEFRENPVALLHSTRAALHFATIAPGKSCIAIVAISHAVAQAAGSGWQSVIVAPHPHDAAMLALAASLCETAFE